MRYIALILALVLAIWGADAFPLHGSNGVSNCTVYDAFKHPLPIGWTGDGGASPAENVTYIVDVSLEGTAGAAFQLVDSTDMPYPTEMNLSRSLQAGRFMVAFVIPRDAVIQGMNVIPSDGEPFGVAWDTIAKYTNGVANLRYYGIAGSDVGVLNRSITLEIALSNNATSGSFMVSPADFTILDQWGWRYFADATFDTMELPPKTMARLGLSFKDMSPGSRPVRLEYHPSSEEPIIVDMGDCPLQVGTVQPLAYPQKSMTADTSSLEQLQAPPAANPPVGQEAVTQAGGSPQVPDTTMEKVNEARARLAKVQEQLRGK